MTLQNVKCLSLLLKKQVAINLDSNLMAFLNYNS